MGGGDRKERLSAANIRGPEGLPHAFVNRSFRTSVSQPKTLFFMPSCLIGLGSNLGNRRKTLKEAVARLSQHPQVVVVTVSRLHENPPIGGPAGQPPFENGAARLETTLSPQALLDLLHAIESDLGRQRQEPQGQARWKPRTIDLDSSTVNRTTD